MKREDLKGSLLHAHISSCVNKIKVGQAIINEPPLEKTNNLHKNAKPKAQISSAVTAKLISAFVFAKRIVKISSL